MNLSRQLITHPTTLFVSWLPNIPAKCKAYLRNRICSGSHIPPSWMVRAGCDFVAGIHPSTTWMSGSSQSVQWNACVHRLDHGLYSPPKEIFRVWCQNPWKEKIPSTGGLAEGQTHNAASCRTASPTHFQLSYSSPLISAQDGITVLGNVCIHVLCRICLNVWSLLKVDKLYWSGWAQITPTLDG